MKELFSVFAPDTMPAIEELRAALNKYIQQSDKRNPDFGLIDIMCVLASAVKRNDGNLQSLLYALESAAGAVESWHLANHLQELREKLYVHDDEHGNKWGD